MGPGHTIFVTCLCDSRQVRSVCVAVSLYSVCLLYTISVGIRDIFYNWVFFQQRYYARLFNREWMKSKGLLDSIPDSFRDALPH